MERLTRRIEIRLTQKQYEILESMARKEWKSLSEMLRQCIGLTLNKEGREHGKLRK